MPRSFIAASTQWGNAPCDLPLYPMSFSAWFRPTAFSDLGTIVGAYLSTSSRNANGLYFDPRSTPEQVAAFSFSTSKSSAAFIDITETTPEWIHAVAVFRAGDDREIFYKGASVTDATSGRAPADIDRFNVAATGGSGANQYEYTGAVAEAAVFDRALTQREINSLHAGYSAARLRPYCYWPLYGSQSPEPSYSLGSGDALTLVNNPLRFAGPPPVQPPYGFDAVPILEAEAPQPPARTAGPLVGGQPIAGLTQGGLAA